VLFVVLLPAAEWCYCRVRAWLAPVDAGTRTPRGGSPCGRTA
jgi:hypothetical protein